MRRFGGRHFYIRSAAACLRMKDLYEGVRAMGERIGGLDAAFVHAAEPVGASLLAMTAVHSKMMQS